MTPYLSVLFYSNVYAILFYSFNFALPFLLRVIVICQTVATRIVTIPGVRVVEEHRRVGQRRSPLSEVKRVQSAVRQSNPMLFCLFSLCYGWLSQSASHAMSVHLWHYYLHHDATTSNATRKVLKHSQTERRGDGRIDCVSTCCKLLMWEVQRWPKTKRTQELKRRSSFLWTKLTLNEDVASDNGAVGVVGGHDAMFGGDERSLVVSPGIQVIDAVVARRTRGLDGDQREQQQQDERNHDHHELLLRGEPIEPLANPVQHLSLRWDHSQEEMFFRAFFLWFCYVYRVVSIYRDGKHGYWASELVRCSFVACSSDRLFCESKRSMFWPSTSS